MIKYLVTINKDHATVTCRYQVEVEVGGSELIADFSVFVDGKDIIRNSASGNTIFSGTEFAKLADENKDVAVNISVSSNTGWSADGADILRGGHPFDDAQFSN